MFNVFKENLCYVPQVEMQFTDVPYFEQTVIVHYRVFPFIKEIFQTFKTKFIISVQTVLRQEQDDPQGK